MADATEQRQNETAPANEEERGVRRDGWRQFLMGVREAMTDPVKSQVIMQLGSSLTRDRAPGQSGTDFLGRAMQSANAAGGRAESALNDQVVTSEKLGQQDRALDQRDAQLSQRGEIAERAEEGKDRRHTETVEANREIAEQESLSDERRHSERMAAQNRLLAAQERNARATLNRMNITHEERMAAQATLRDIEREKIAWQRFSAGTKTAVEIMKIATEVATSEDELGQKSVDAEKLGRTFNQMMSAAGASVTGFEDTEKMSRATALLDKLSAEGVSSEELVKMIDDEKNLTPAEKTALREQYGTAAAAPAAAAPTATSDVEFTSLRAPREPNSTGGNFRGSGLSGMLQDTYHHLMSKRAGAKPGTYTAREVRRAKELLRESSISPSERRNLGELLMNIDEEKGVRHF